MCTLATKAAVEYNYYMYMRQFDAKYHVQLFYFIYEFSCAFNTFLPISHHSHGQHTTEHKLGLNEFCDQGVYKISAFCEQYAHLMTGNHSDRIHYIHIEEKKYLLLLLLNTLFLSIEMKKLEGNGQS